MIPQNMIVQDTVPQNTVPQNTIRQNLKCRARDLPLSVPLAAAIALCLASTGHAATILVNSASAGSDAGKCSIFDAVQAVNTSAPVSGCAAGNGSNDTIDLSALSTPTTITFTLHWPTDNVSALALSKAATIRGKLDASGNPVVALVRDSAAPKFRLISTNASLTLQGIKLSGGMVQGRGGAVFSSGPGLALYNSVITGNTAQGNSSSGGGIAVDSGALTIDRSRIDHNTAGLSGGGVYNAQATGGAITINSSTVSYNTALAGVGGGAATFSGTAVSASSAFYYNTAPKGGGIYSPQSVTLTNSTFSQNTANDRGGGVYAKHSSKVYFSTFANNTIISMSGYGGGLASEPGPSGSAYFKAIGSIFVNNSKDDVYLGDESYTHCAGGNNIIASHQGCAPINSDNSCSPGLLPLADNGGSTLTRALPMGSCAIDSGPPALPGMQTDQRGSDYLRKFGSATDFGAFELQTNERIFYDGFEFGS